ncbi:hypothetical protein [Streptomyces griseorubiginosus]|uniref:hypothetical protein n=1 Tax=Streptomyces griseorubiginosus TaxID=67304 RepID=UPI002E8243CB|nr:hypothetical protein [Streptomyces griseorubiginosus]WUB45333.1 hypothetical protein OHN19_19060 [Streptomyces griseorubiginosus]WUB53850.1 hypothetical protein OG942_19055 [Streptomyces griseorubiginosus]
MIIVFAPKDREQQTFDAGRGKLRASEIQIIERTADARWPDIKEGVARGDIHAMRVVVWAIRKRTEPALRFGDFDPFEGELYSRLDANEVRAYAESLFEQYRENPDDLAEAFDELRDSAFDPEDAATAIADVTAPKDPVPAPESLPEATEEASPSDG